MISDDSTLSLDFTTGLLDSRLTFTRSTTGTYINSSGYVTSAAINAPRFDYDPTTLEPCGLLIEGSANNLVLSSIDLTVSGVWVPTGTGIVIQGGQGPSPDGTLNATKLAPGTAGNYITATTAALSANTVYTLSCWFKKLGSNSTAVFSVANGASWASGAGAITFNFDNPSASTTVGSIVSWTWKLFPNGWYRIELVHTTSASPTGAGIRLQVTGLGADGYLAYGPMVEAGSGASSYIPTGASTGNRAADSCVMTGTNFSSWFAGATEGVFYAEYEAPRSRGTADYFCLGTVYAAGTFIGMNLANSTRYPQALISPGGGFRLSGGISVAASTPMKHAAKWSGANNVLVFANGAVGTAHSATSGTPTLTMFSIGSSSTSGTAATGDYLNACMRRVKFWRVALPDSRIISITT